MLRIDLQPIADSMRECSLNMSLAVGLCGLCYLAAKLWQWR